MRALLARLRPLRTRGCVGMTERAGRRTASTSTATSSQQDEGERGRRRLLCLAATGGAMLAGGLMLGDLQELQAKTREENILEITGERRAGLPEYSMEEVSSHHTREGGGRVWVIFKNGVYDITDFIPLHPGAEKLLMAAGKDIEETFYWKMLRITDTRWQCRALLENIRSSPQQHSHLRGAGKVSDRQPESGGR